MKIFLKIIVIKETFISEIPLQISRTCWFLKFFKTKKYFYKTWVRQKNVNYIFVNYFFFWDKKTLFFFTANKFTILNRVLYTNHYLTQLHNTKNAPILFLEWRLDLVINKCTQIIIKFHIAMNNKILVWTIRKNKIFRIENSICMYSKLIWTCFLNLKDLYQI